MSLWDVKRANAAGVMTWYDFEKIGFKPLRWSGFGLSAVRNQHTEYANRDGGFFESRRFASRMGTIGGVVAGNVENAFANGGSLSNSYDAYQAARQQVIDVFKRPGGVLVRYRGGAVPLVGVVRYDAGLSGGQVSGFSERLVLTLLMVTPEFKEETTNTASLTARIDLTDTLILGADSGWAGIAAGAVRDAVYDEMGNVYYVANDGVYKWTRSTLSASLIAGSHTSFNATARIAVGGLRVYVVTANGGGFTVRYFNGFSWSNVTQVEYGTYGGGDSGAVTALNYLSSAGALGDDLLMIGTHIDNSSSGSGDSWKAWSFDGTSVTLRDEADDGAFYWFEEYYSALLGVGSFTTIESRVVRGIGRYTTSGGGFVEYDNIDAISYFGRNPSAQFAHWKGGGGVLTLVGTFNRIGGRTVTAVAQHNGYAWTDLDAGDLAIDENMRVAAADSDTGEIYVYAPNADSIGYTSELIALLDGDWRSIALLDSAGIKVCGVYGGEPLLITDGSVGVAGIAGLSHSGSADSYPRIVFENTTAAPIDVYTIKNIMSQKVINFNLKVNAGEVVTVLTGLLREGEQRVTSDVRGNLAGVILSGSEVGRFALLAADWVPGETTRATTNDIALLASDAGLTAELKWENHHLGIDGGAVKA